MLGQGEESIVGGKGQGRWLVGEGLLCEWGRSGAKAAGERRVG